ncbi:MAG: hypothetical protein AAF657_06495 [Acidobacteriota bacterium]
MRKKHCYQSSKGPGSTSTARPNQIRSMELTTLIFVLLISTGVAPSSTRTKATTIEIAPRELGEYRADSEILLAASSKEGEVLVLNKDDLTVTRFREDGKSWGAPLPLRFSGLAPFPSVIRLDTLRSRLAVTGSDGVYTFSDEGFLQSSKRLFQPSDVAIVSESAVAVSLVNIPHPTKPGHFLARKEFEANVPRIITLDNQLDTSDIGLPIDDSNDDASSIVGSSLRLAAGHGRIFAAEIASYRIYELDEDLRPVAVFSELDRLGGSTISPSETSAGEANQELREAHQSESSLKQEKVPGRDLGRRPPLASEAKLRFQYPSIVKDIAWDNENRKLIVLTALADQKHLFGVDYLDPDSGVLNRIKVKLPGKENQDTRLTQIAAGQHYVWFRAFDGQTPTFRLSKAVLESGDEIQLDGGSLLAPRDHIAASVGAPTPEGF